MADESRAMKDENGEKKPQLLMARKIYKGIPMFENEVEKIETMDTRPDDIWVCSFPRSGTTLTQEMTYLVQTLDFDTALSVQLDVRFPIIDVKDDRYPYYKDLRSSWDESIEHYQPQGIFIGLYPHFQFENKNACMAMPNTKGEDTIYIARNPKDIVTSFYRLMRWGNALQEMDATWDLFVDAFINGQGLYGHWPRHVLGFWEASRKNDNILFLKYEDVVQDLPAACRQIADFLDRKLTDDDVNRICQHCQVDRMRSNNNVNMSYYKTFKRVNEDQEGGFINQGRAGAWKDLLSPEIVARCDTLIAQLEGSGLEIRDH
ncbi:sulfotransferase 1A1-like [Mya arenaria]|uniref:sulfotransferase 1A1-like n=1 Tax=Mya arenaria TaxID=6604 RepID=UPI0022E050F8|nr:sulfotransferase 1A1-like [Mya arenaria]